MGRARQRSAIRRGESFVRSFTDIFIKKPVLALVVNLIILGVGYHV